MPACHIIQEDIRNEGYSSSQVWYRTQVSSQPKINSFRKKILPSNARDKLTTELIKYVSVDLRPYSSVNGVGLQSLCQTLVNLGAQYGNFDVKVALSDRKTVARHVPRIVAENKAEVKKKLATCDYIAIKTDGWTDYHRKISYVTVTAHFFDTNLNLQSCILNTGAVHEKKTAEVMCNVVKDVVVELGCEMAKVTIVSDSAANMIAAFRGQCCRSSCYAHSLNLVVNEIISVTVSDFQEFLTGCKNLVRHFKHAGLQQKLEKTSKQECPKRWNFYVHHAPIHQ
jgi:Hermes transposase DNA-binding domain